MSRAKRHIATLLCLAVLLQMPWSSAGVTRAYAEGTQPVSPASIPSVNYSCVTIAPGGSAFAAGSGGTIIKSVDGGDTWTSVGPGGDKTFTGIALWDETRGLAVTRDKSVYYTADGGDTWIQSTPNMNSGAGGSAVYLRVVNALAVVPGSTSDARLAGGTQRSESTILYGEQVWATSLQDGVYWGSEPLPWSGQYYNEPDESGTPYWVGKGEFRSITFGSSTHGWAVGVDHYNTADAATVYASTDGGDFWNRQTFSTALDLTGVSAANSSVAVITSSAGRIFRTSNGGSTWVEASTVPASAAALNAVALSSSTAGWAVGTAGAMLRTTNGGDTWTKETSLTTRDLSAIELSGSKGIAVGNVGTVLVTDDGDSWRVAGSGPPQDTVTAVIDSVSPNPAVEGRTVTFTGHGSDSLGHGITAYEWKEDTTVLSTAASFTKSNLSVGPHTIAFRVKCSNNTWSAPVNKTVTIKANSAPVAVADSYSTTANTAKLVAAPGVLSNDTDADGDALTASVVSQPTHGALTLASAGGFLYTPATDYRGPDSFTYRAFDGETYSNTVTVSLDVTVANAKSWFSYLSGYQRVSYGRTAGFSGILKSGDTPLEGQTVMLQRLSGRTSGTWIDVDSGVTSSSGYVRFSVPASSSGYNYTKTYYRLRFAGATGYDGVWTVSRYVDPKVYLSRPWSSKSRVYRKRTYSWYATLKPRHSGKPVKMYFQRYYKGKWRHYTTRYASAYNWYSYSRVKARYAIPYKGRWRVRAYHDDGGHLRTYSSWRYVTVR